MKNIILNEKKYTEELMNSSVLPENVSINVFVSYLTRYYYEENYTLKETQQTICNKLQLFNLDSAIYQEYVAYARIERYYNALKNGKLALLRNYDNIPLYKSEYNKIIECNNDKERKLLFTLYILGRYTDRHGWVYISHTDIFKLSNISASIKDKYILIGSLVERGLVKSTKKVDDTKIGVELSEGDEEVVMRVNEINYLGNQIMAFMKSDCKMCVNCGRLIKIKNNNGRPPMYCKSCGIEKNIEKTNKKQKEKRKSLKN